MCSTHSSCLTFHLLWDFLCSYRWLCMCHAISLADKPWILIREHALILWFSFSSFIFGALRNLYQIIWILFIYLPIFIFSWYVYIPSTSGMTCIFHDACLHLPLLLWKAYSSPLCGFFFFTAALITHSIKCNTYLTQSVLQSFKLTFLSYVYLLWTG